MKDMKERILVPLVIAFAIVSTTLVASVVRPFKRVDGNYRIVSLECESGTFQQEYVETFDFNAEGNYFWAGAKVVPGDYNLDGEVHLNDIISTINMVLKADTAVYYPPGPGIAVYYSEDGVITKIKFVEKLK